MSHLKSFFLAGSVSVLFAACAPVQDTDSAISSQPSEMDEREVRREQVQQGEDYGQAQSSGHAPVVLRSRVLPESAAEKALMYQVEKSTLAGWSPDQVRPPVEPVNRENYANFTDNPVRVATEHPVSTFSIDVDTGSYSNVRRMLAGGEFPPEDAVRVEELINYFDYTYAGPDGEDEPFAVHTEVATTPWNPDTVLLHVGIQGYEVSMEQIPSSNLVFLIDVSGSMRSPNKLGLLKNAIKLLVGRMREQDQISIAVYAGASGIVLDPVAGNNRAAIQHALDQLSAGGSTNGASGIRLAYSLARQHFIKDGVNRVILATDGDFNVGMVDFESLKDLVERERESGVTLTTLGFGAGNYNDHLMEQLADAGNGNYAYIDTLSEAQKVLVDEAGSTLHTIAQDVKIQIEFNPDIVAEYRLIGYENRILSREDFNNDRIDAGDIGAGHTVTALYELSLANSIHRWVEPLRYGDVVKTHAPNTGELAFVKLRYKQPGAKVSRLMTEVIELAGLRTQIDQASDGFRFASAVAAFAQILRGGKYLRDFGYTEVLQLARGSRGDDPYGYRSEFLRLVGLANNLHPGRPLALN